MRCEYPIPISQHEYVVSLLYTLSLPLPVSLSLSLSLCTSLKHSPHKVIVDILYTKWYDGERAKRMK